MIWTGRYCAADTAGVNHLGAYVQTTGYGLLLQIMLSVMISRLCACNASDMSVSLLELQTQRHKQSLVMENISL